MSEINTRVPEEDELIVINIDSFERSRARLQLQPTPRCASFASPDPEAAGFDSPDSLGSCSVSSDEDSYRRQPLQV